MTRMNICHVKMALIMYLSGVRNTTYGNQVLSWNCVNRGSGGVKKVFHQRAVGMGQSYQSPGSTGTLLSLRHRVWLGAMWSQGLGLNNPYRFLST